MLVPCKVSRACLDATGLLVRAGGTAQLRRDPKGNLPKWAEPLEPERPAEEKPAKPSGDGEKRGAR